MLVMGGPMGAYEDAEHPWLEPRRSWSGRPPRTGRPILGVCLGVQVLAAALGAEVRPMEQAEVGLLPVELTTEGRAHPLFAGMPEPLVSLQWHGDTFELPDGAKLLASSPAAPNQAFQAGEAAYGVQFHLEVTPEMAREWAQVPAYRDSLAATLGEERGAEFLAEVERRATELHPAATTAVRELAGPGLSLKPGPRNPAFVQNCSVTYSGRRIGGGAFLAARRGGRGAPG